MFVLYTPFIDFLIRIGIKVPNSAAVTVSPRVGEILKTNTHGLVSLHEHCQN